MNAIKPLAETAETVTLARADYEALLIALEDAIDNAALDAQEGREATEGKETARADYLPAELARRLLTGESPVRIWRLHRGLSLRGLAERASVSPGYLSEIEGGQKPGSASALHALAKALGVRMEELLSD